MKFRYRAVAVASASVLVFGGLTACSKHTNRACAAEPSSAIYILAKNTSGGSHVSSGGSKSFKSNSGSGSSAKKGTTSGGDVNLKKAPVASKPLTKITRKTGSAAAPKSFKYKPGPRVVKGYPAQTRYTVRHGYVQYPGYTGWYPSGWYPVGYSSHYGCKAHETGVFRTLVP